MTKKLTKQQIIDGLNDDTYFPDGTEIEETDMGYMPLAAWLAYYLTPKEVAEVARECGLDLD